MSTPLTAVYRFVFSYTVDNLTHLLRTYCRLTPSGDVTGYDVQVRGGFSNVGASVAIDGLLSLIAPLYRSTVTAFNPVEIQSHLGIAWLPISSYVPTVTPSGSSGAYGPAEQLTMSMRDTAFHKVRLIALEGLWSGPLKTKSPHGFGGAFNAFADGFVTVPGSPVGQPYLWQVGRSSEYIGSFVSMVVADNDKIRRARGVA